MGERGGREGTDGGGERTVSVSGRATSRRERAVQSQSESQRESQRQCQRPLRGSGFRRCCPVAMHVRIPGSHACTGITPVCQARPACLLERALSPPAANLISPHLPPSLPPSPPYWYPQLPLSTPTTPICRRREHTQPPPLRAPSLLAPGAAHASRHRALLPSTARCRSLGPSKKIALTLVARCI